MSLNNSSFCYQYLVSEVIFVCVVIPEKTDFHSCFHHTGVIQQILKTEIPACLKKTLALYSFVLYTFWLRLIFTCRRTSPCFCDTYFPSCSINKVLSCLVWSHILLHSWLRNRLSNGVVKKTGWPLGFLSRHFVQQLLLKQGRITIIYI